MDLLTSELAILLVRGEGSKGLHWSHPVLCPSPTQVHLPRIGTMPVRGKLTHRQCHVVASSAWDWRWARASSMLEVPFTTAVWAVYTSTTHTKPNRISPSVASQGLRSQGGLQFVCPCGQMLEERMRLGQNVDTRESLADLLWLSLPHILIMHKWMDMWMTGKRANQKVIHREYECFM